MITKRNISLFWQHTSVLLIMIFATHYTQAQEQKDGSLGLGEALFVGDNSTFYFESGVYSFELGSTMTTRTKTDYGLVSFALGASWTGASDDHFIDGYAQTAQNTPFTLPIGQSGVYAPIQIVPTSSAGVNAAYFRNNPSTIGTNYEDSIKAISSMEYWDIQSVGVNATISLSWRASSDITILTGSSLSKLTIIGWDGSKWVSIPSTIDQSSILGKNSDLNSGSIHSDAIVDLSAYSNFSLGAMGTVALSIPELNKHEVVAFINNSVLSIESSSRITGVVIFDVTGKTVSSEKINGAFMYNTPFYHEEAVYVAKIEMDDGASVATKKLINRIK